MKSNIREKINNFIGKIKTSYRKFMFKEAEIERIENRKKMKLKDRIKQNPSEYVFRAVIACLVVGILGTAFINSYKRDKERYTEFKPTIEAPELKGTKRSLKSEELDKYMIDSKKNIYVKTAQTKLDDLVAYSLTYDYDIIPKGDMTATSYLTQGYMVSILLQGYPTKTYEEMNLKSNEEAYLATQLAVYELVSHEQYDDIANGEFSIDDIVPASEEYSDMVERVVNKAREMYNNAMDNPYKDQTEGRLVEKQDYLEVDGNETIIGPYVPKTETDEDTKKYLGDRYKPVTKVSVNSYVEGSKATVVDKDGKEKSVFDDGDGFYIKVVGTDKIFSQFTMESMTNHLYARIYETNENKKKYVTLEAKEVSFMSISSVIHGFDYGNLEINFYSDNEDIIEGVCYRIYDEKGQLIQDIEGYAAINEFSLPVGNYEIEVYEIPEKYFIDGYKYKVEIKDQDEAKLNIHLDSLK